MAFITLALVHSAAASLLQDVQSGPSPYVLDYIDKMNGDCTSSHCIDELDRCADGSDPECQNRLNCIRDAGTANAGKCLKEMKWAQLDDTEVKVLDCAHSNKCMPQEWQGESSFIELLSKEKEQRGLSVEGNAMTSEEQAALQVVAAHLVYLEKTEEMVKRTQGMMDEVLKDKSMGLEEKIEALHMLTGHLSLLQESAKKTMQGMGMDTADFETEEQDEEDEEKALEEKMHGHAESVGEPATAETKATEEGNPKAKAEAQAKGKAQAEAKDKAEKKPEKAKSEEKPEAKAVKKPEAKADKKPEPKPDKKSEAKVEKKPEKKAATEEAKKKEAGAKNPESKKPNAFVETDGKTELNMRTMEE